MSIKCGNCNKTDGKCYMSNPPKVRCTLTGEYHEYGDSCNVENMDNSPVPIRDLRDIKSICGGRKSSGIGCAGCELDGRYCDNGVTRNPSDWNLNLEVTLTDEDLCLVKTIRKLFPNADYLERLGGSNVLGLSNSTQGWICDIDPNLFPNIPKGVSLYISDVKPD